MDLFSRHTISFQCFHIKSGCISDSANTDHMFILEGRKGFGWVGEKQTYNALNIDLRILSGSLCWSILQCFHLLTFRGAVHGAWFSSAQKITVSNPLKFKLLDFYFFIAWVMTKARRTTSLKVRIYWTRTVSIWISKGCGPLLEAAFIHGIASHFRANNVCSCSLTSLNGERSWILQ